MGNTKKILNFLSFYFSLGSCLFLISIINTKDVYIEIFKNATFDNKDTYLTLATVLFNTPTFIFVVVAFIGLVFKEFYLKALATKFKINAISAFIFLLLNLAAIFVINAPTM